MESISSVSNKQSQIDKVKSLVSKRSTTVEIFSALLIFLFIYTAVSKILDFEQFKFDTNNQPFPNSLTPVIIYTLPVSEIAIALLLFFKKTKRSGFALSSVLMALFTIYTGVVLLGFFDKTPCSCGGVIKNLTWMQHLLFNFFFFGISYWGFRLTKKNKNVLK